MVVSPYDCTYIARAAINCVRSTNTRTRKNAKKADKYTIEREDYINIKCYTWAINYGYMEEMLYLLDTVMLEVKFTARNIILHKATNSIIVCMIDVLKVISFSELVVNKNGQ